MTRDLFEGDRVRFRAVSEDDLPLFHAWWSDPEVARLQVDTNVRLAQESTNIEMFRGWFADGPANAGFTIVHRVRDEPIGFCNLWGASVKNRDAALAILIAEPYWGQGLGTEALRLLVHYGFCEMNLHRLHLSVHAFNERALRAYERAGFRECGRARQALFRDGRWHDVVAMDQLQPEYLERVS